MPIKYSTFTSIVPYFDPDDFERRRRLPPIATMHEAKDWGDFVLAMARMRYVWPADEDSKKHDAGCVSPALYRAPALARDNGNVVGWGAFMGIDLDDGGIPLDAVTECFTELGLNHLIYSTTKCTPEHWRLRVLFSINRELTCAEVPTAWRSMIRYMAAFKPDTSCKDLSRLYVAPMIWVSSAADPSKKPNKTPVTAFEYRYDLGALDIDDCMARYPDPSPAGTERASQKSVWNAPAGGFVGSGSGSSASRQLPRGLSIFDSPVVTSKAIRDYLTLGPGEHHTGLFSFMCSIIAHAKKRGYSIGIQDVVDYAHQIDAQSPYPRDPIRMANLHREVERAFDRIGHPSPD